MSNTSIVWIMAGQESSNSSYRGALLRKTLKLSTHNLKITNGAMESLWQTVIGFNSLQTLTSILFHVNLQFFQLETKYPSLLLDFGLNYMAYFGQSILADLKQAKAEMYLLGWAWQYPSCLSHEKNTPQEMHHPRRMKDISRRICPTFLLGAKAIQALLNLTSDE